MLCVCVWGGKCEKGGQVWGKVGRCERVGGQCGGEDLELPRALWHGAGLCEVRSQPGGLTLYPAPLPLSSLAWCLGSAPSGEGEGGGGATYPKGSPLQWGGGATLPPSLPLARWVRCTAVEPNYISAPLPLLPARVRYAATALQPPSPSPPLYEVRCRGASLHFWDSPPPPPELGALPRSLIALLGLSG